MINLNKKKTAGFTMVEVVVAMALVAIALTAVFFALRTCSVAAHHSRMLTDSVLLAEKLFIESQLKENAAYETREGQDGLYSWVLKISPTPVENLGSVHVLVKWKEQQRQQQYELYTLVKMQSFKD